MLFEEAYKEYLIYARNQHKKQGFITLESKLRNWVYPFFKDFNIEDIKIQDILNWQNELYSKNFKNSYLESIYTHFNTLYDYFVKMSYTSLNLVHQVGQFKKKFEEKHIDFYNYSEFNLFIKFVDNIIYKLFFEFMYFTGCRPGEALALKFSDIHGNYVHISKSMTKDRKSVV